MVLFEREPDGLGAVEERQHVVVAVSERTQQNGGVLTPFPVDANTDDVALVDLELQPCSPSGDHLAAEELFVGRLVEVTREVNAG